MPLTDQISLIVDGSAVNSTSVAAVLRSEFRAQRVFSSSTARQAMGVARNHPKIDWIFADTDLPDGSGFDFLAGVRRLPSVRHANVVLMSTRRDKETLTRAAAAGVTDYIAKPFTAATLIGKLHRQFEGKGKRAAERVSTLAVFDVDICFDRTSYAGKLLDISLGGCRTRSDPFKRSQTCVFDVAEITVKHDCGDVSFRAELARIERCTDPETPGLFIASGFQFGDLTDEMRSGISKFISTMAAEHARLPPH